MSWSKVKGVIGAALPAVASILGTPFAAGAIASLCNALGLKNDASDDEIAQAYLNATPEQIAQLKAIESNERIRMAEITAYDKDSARNREKTVKDNTTKILAYVTSTAFFLTIFLVGTSFINISGAEKDIFCILIGQLSMKFGSIIDYYFGTYFDKRKDSEGFKK